MSEMYSGGWQNSAMPDVVGFIEKFQQRRAQRDADAAANRDHENQARRDAEALQTHAESRVHHAPNSEPTSPLAPSFSHTPSPSTRSVQFSNADSGVHPQGPRIPHAGA